MEARLSLVNETHDPARKSWVPSANQAGCEFPIQNLPFVRFAPADSTVPWRMGVGIGDQILDLKLALAQTPLAAGTLKALAPLAEGDLPGFMAMGMAVWRDVRLALSRGLAQGSELAPFLELCLVPQKKARYALPCAVPNFTSFNTSAQHGAATAAWLGSQPLSDGAAPQAAWAPLATHGKAASFVLDGAGVKRPRGLMAPTGHSPAQTPRGGPVEPSFGPSRSLDYSLQLAWWLGGQNPMGQSLDMVQAEQRLFGVSLLNAWCARDVQAWELGSWGAAGPLCAGGFSSVGFVNSLSPWLVTAEALAPFRRPAPRSEGCPAPLPHLDSSFNRLMGAFDLQLSSSLLSAQMREQGLPPQRLALSRALHARWTPAQMLSHQTANGSPVHLGDVMATGTLSGPREGEGACLMEQTEGGRKPFMLRSGESRRYLEDGDTIALKAWCQGEGLVGIALPRVAGTVQA